MSNPTPRTDSVYTLPQDRAGAQFEMTRTLELELATARSTMALARAVIATMQATEEQVFEGFYDPNGPSEDEPNIDNHNCFGGFENWGLTNIDGAGPERPVVIEWPDLRMAFEALRRTLGEVA